MSNIVIKCKVCGKKRRISKLHKYHFGNECNDCTRNAFMKEASDFSFDDILVLWRE